MNCWFNSGIFRGAELFLRRAHAILVCRRNIGGEMRSAVGKELRRQAETVIREAISAVLLLGGPL